MNNNIVVDPVIVLMPDENASKAEIEGWLRNLQAWLAEVFNSPHQWFHLAEITLKHVDYTKLPNFKTLNAWQSRYNIEIDIPELLNGVTEFFLHEGFALQQKIEQQLLEAGCVAGPERSTVIIRPTDFVERWPAALREDLSFVFAQACAAKHKQIQIALNLFVATREMVLPEKKIEISAHVTFLSDSEEEIVQTILEALPLLFTPGDIEPPDVITLWKQGYKGICQAIELQFANDWSITVGKPLSFTLGAIFIDSVIKWGLHTNPVVLQKIVRYAAAVIAQQAQNVRGCKLHPLRENEAADSDQRIRASDGATGWRLMVAKRGAGWRLHYWHIPGYDGGTIEFWNVEKETGSKNM